MQVGFVGMGRMGVPMALNVLKAGHELMVYNRTASRCTPVAEAGAAVAGSPAEAATGADAVVTMVADPPAAAAVILGADGILAGASRGCTVIEMSTIGPPAAKELAGAAAEKEVAFLDAPVSGSVGVAEQAQLTVMVGGEVATFERMRPLLESMSKAQFHLGPSGAGAAMKLAVNTVIGIMNQAIAECLALAAAGGIEPEVAYDVLKNSSAAAPYVHYREQAYLDPLNQPAGFTAPLMRKDLALAFQMAAERNVPVPAARATDEFLAVALDLGYDKQDMAVIAHVINEIVTRQAES